MRKNIRSSLCHILMEASHLSIFKRVTLIAYLCAFIVFSPSQAHAQYAINGLENHQEVKDYIAKVVTEKYADIEPDLIRPSKIQADILKAMHAKGYYNARVSRAENENTESENLTFDVITGKQFMIESIAFEGYDYAGELSLAIGDPLDAGNVMIEQARIFTDLSESDCIYKLDVRNKVILNREDRTAALTFLITGGMDASFGGTEFNGAENVGRKYLRRFIAYEQGACWDEQKIESTKSALLKTGLLSSVEITLPETAGEDGIIPINIDLKERSPRTVRLGAKYSTSEGPGVIAEWRHRNLLGGAENLSVKSQISLLKQALSTAFTKPFLWSKKNTFNANAGVERQETEAFEELAFNTSASIKRKLADHWTGSLGIAFEASQITEENGEEKTFGLISYPGQLNFDNRDNALDPHSGFNLGLSAEPFYDTFGEANPFFKTKLTGTTYFDLSDHKSDPVLALRGAWGSISGTNTEDVPASERFYAGGGGSIRGFGYQEAGPKDDTGDPTGGRSLLETSVEGRIKVTETIGAVAFVDAGGVFDSAYPDFDESLFVGAGLGARYYTSFGPIRFDVAVPVNKREEADQAFQIYISIGQAF